MSATDSKGLRKESYESLDKKETSQKGSAGKEDQSDPVASEKNVGSERVSPKGGEEPSVSINFRTSCLFAQKVENHFEFQGYSAFEAVLQSCLMLGISGLGSFCFPHSANFLKLNNKLLSLLLLSRDSFGSKYKVRSLVHTIFLHGITHFY